MTNITCDVCGNPAEYDIIVRTKEADPYEWKADLCFYCHRKIRRILTGVEVLE